MPKMVIKHKAYKMEHTNNQKGIEKANNCSKENARKEAAAATNKIQIHSSMVHTPFKLVIFKLAFLSSQHTASVKKNCGAAHLDKRERSSSQVLNTEEIGKRWRLLLLCSLKKWP
jgi:hypothetical protein